VLTVVESPIFQRLWPRYWEEDERAEFATFIALDPEAGEVYLLTLYAKSESENLPLSTIKEIRRALEV
jgi:hypothetical protein